MSTGAGQTQWNPIDENIDNPEKRNADEAYEAQRNVDFSGNAKKLNKSLYGEGHTCTPEEKEYNEQQFQERYSADLSELLTDEISVEIGTSFKKTGDIESAVFLAISKMDIPEDNKELLTEKITEYLDPRRTSIRIDEKLRSDKGLSVQSGMTASDINAFIGSNRHINLNASADMLQTGDTLSYGDDATSLMRNDTSIIGKLNEETDDLNEITGQEFSENRYAPIIDLYTVNEASLNDPLHDISGEQVEQIGNEYAKGTDIVKAMQDVLGYNHRAVEQVKKLDNPEGIDERRAQMYKDLGVENQCRVNSKTGEGGDLITNLISENYTRILGPDGKIDTQASVILATQISANKIIEGKHTFTRSEEFNKAYERIQTGSTSPQELQQDLLLIHTTVNNAEGIRGKSRQNEAYRIKRRAEQKTLFLSAEFQEIQTLLIQAQESGDKQGVQEQREAADKMQKTQVASGEVMSGGKFDLMAQLDATVAETA